MAGGSAMISVFIREPEFVGQTKDRLATQEAARLVESAVRDRFDHWLAADTRTAGAILDYLVLKAEERLRRRAEKETSRKTAVKKLRLPGKLADCSGATPRRARSCSSSRATSAGGSAKQARDRKTQAVLPLRGKILNVLGRGVVEDDGEPGARRPLPGDGGADRVAVRARRPALREDHHHDRRRRRRGAYRLAADDLLLHPDAAADRRTATSTSRRRRSTG